MIFVYERLFCFAGDTVYCPRISVAQGTTTDSCAAATVGQVCTITCNSGYALTGGSGTLICQSNGQWSGSIPTCTGKLNQLSFWSCKLSLGKKIVIISKKKIFFSVRTCPILAAPVYGGSSGTCSPGQVGQTCNFFCNAGYQLVGQSVLVCGNDGRWSGNPPYCTGIVKKFLWNYFICYRSFRLLNSKGYNNLRLLTMFIISISNVLPSTAIEVRTISGKLWNNLK